MGENTQEKNLIEKKDRGIFSRIKDFFEKMFNKNKKNKITEEKIMKENNEFKEYIKNTEDENVKLLELQRKYRNGEVGQDDLTEEQIEALCDLYDKQIERLRKSIEYKEQKLAEYKQRTQKNNV